MDVEDLPKTEKLEELAQDIYKLRGVGMELTRMTSILLNCLSDLENYINQSIKLRKQ